MLSARFSPGAAGRAAAADALRRAVGHGRVRVRDCDGRAAVVVVVVIRLAGVLVEAHPA